MANIWCMHAAQFIGIGMQQSYMEAHNAVINGSRKGYPSNGINFASAGSGVLPGTNKDWVIFSDENFGVFMLPTSSFCHLLIHWREDIAI